ncbi:cellobiose dehydrogenase [Aspergillus luchuensis IFO 4308]|nr:cellobiose dehydrogenase [Aspergillus luchuensis IFO 4308]
MKWLNLLPIALGLAHASIISFSPPTNPDIIYSLTIPNTTTLSTPGPIYIQITAPTSIQWVGLGQGAQMTGANMFLLYTSSSTKITLSPRSGLGHFEPQYTSNTQITMLPGTGISTINSTTAALTNSSSPSDNTRTTMTANFRCDNCLTWQDGTGTMNPKDTNFPFIWAYRAGVPINSASMDADISIHDDMGGIQVDLTRAGMPPQPNNTTSPDSSSSSSSNTTNPFANYNPLTDSIPAQSTTNPSTTSSPLPNLTKMTHILITHATLMGLSFVLFYPLSALLMPLPISLPISKFRLHMPLQFFTMLMTLAGFGCGIYLAYETGQLRTAHPILGIIVVGVLVLFQPAMGWLQHFGGVIVVGVVNGGIGIHVARGMGMAPVGAVVGYAVVAGVVGGIYLGGLLVAWMVERKRRGVDGEGERVGTVEGREGGDGDGDGEKGGSVEERVG